DELRRALHPRGRLIQTTDGGDTSGRRGGLTEVARALGFRTQLVAPLIRDGAAIGAIALQRNEAVPFSASQTELLKTFADQAVIAIENVRLFTELQQRNADVTEALDQQTATAEILSVISSSPTDVKPVLDVVAQNAARVCGARDAKIGRASCRES